MLSKGIVANWQINKDTTAARLATYNSVSSLGFIFEEQLQKNIKPFKENYLKGAVGDAQSCGRCFGPD